jgi:dienelactone hydrolase
MKTGINWFKHSMTSSISLLKAFRVIFLVIFQTFPYLQGYGQVAVEEKIPENLEEKRTDAYKDQLENYLRDWIINEYPERADLLWDRNYSSFALYEESVAPNRERWKAVLNPPELTKTGPISRTPHSSLQDIGAEWISLPLGPLDAEGILVFPENADADNPVPLVITQHGIGSTPETPFLRDNEAYHAYARELLKAGFAVLSPLNLRSMERRNYIERLCRLIDTTLPGIEFMRLKNLLDVVLTDPRIDPERVGMWGVSLGGMATMFWMPLEPRIKAGVVSAWFNHRLNKMAVPDDRYVSFLVVNEEHAFFRGWLTEFSDHDVVSLICPRPLLIQHGKSDRIAWWPQVEEEFNTAKIHYEKLGIADRFELDIFEGNHESRLESGIPFLEQWLKP